jgi:hypothetical protein
MIKRFAKRTILLTTLLATGATVLVQNVLAQAASSVTLELFNSKPSESSQPTASLEIGANGGDLSTIEAPDKAGKARYLRAKVSGASGVENYVYRVIGNPNNGTLFVITPDSKVIMLKKLLTSTGLEVGKDKSVKLGAQTDFSGTKSAVTDVSVDAGKATGSSATASATSTETATNSSATAAPTETATNSSTAASTAATPEATTTPASTSSTTSTSAEASATPAPADANATPAPASSSTTPEATATPAAPADASATPATDANATPAASTSGMASADATPLTKPVSTTVGQVEVTVIPSGTPAPASSEKNIILAPVSDAQEAKSSVDGTVVTLTYASKSSLEAVAKFYDDQLKAQGFDLDAASPDNQQNTTAFIKVFKRGNASIMMSVRAENGEYMVEVDLEKLANAS